MTTRWSIIALSSHEGLLFSEGSVDTYIYGYVTKKCFQECQPRNKGIMQYISQAR